MRGTLEECDARDARVMRYVSIFTDRPTARCPLISLGVREEGGERGGGYRVIIKI